MIPRIGASVTRYGTAVLRQFELMGAYTPNSSDAILRARDKLRCHQLLAGKGIGLPTTVFGDNPDDTADLLALLGTPPHVIKLIEGTQGNGVVLAEKLVGLAQRRSRPSAGCMPISWSRNSSPRPRARTCAASWSATPWWRRCAGRREQGEFRSNLHRGGSARPA